MSLITKKSNRKITPKSIKIIARWSIAFQVINNWPIIEKSVCFNQYIDTLYECCLLYFGI